MSDCPCGGMTKSSQALEKSRILEFAVCKACGRIGREVLRDRESGAWLAAGNEARCRFQQGTG